MTSSPYGVGCDIEDRRKWPANCPWDIHRVLRATLITPTINAATIIDADLVNAVFVAFTSVDNVTFHPTSGADSKGKLWEIQLTDDVVAFGNVLNAAIDEQDRRRGTEA